MKVQSIAEWALVLSGIAMVIAMAAIALWRGLADPIM